MTGIPTPRCWVLEYQGKFWGVTYADGYSQSFGWCVFEDKVAFTTPDIVESETEPPITRFKHYHWVESPHPEMLKGRVRELIVTRTLV